MTGRKAIPGIEMRLTADRTATLRKTLKDCQFIAKKCNIIVLVMVSCIDMAIGPTSDVESLHRIYSKQIIEKARKRESTKHLRARLFKVLGLKEAA